MWQHSSFRATLYSKIVLRSQQFCPRTRSLPCNVRDVMMSLPADITAAHAQKVLPRRPNNPPSCRVGPWQSNINIIKNSMLVFNILTFDMWEEQQSVLITTWTCGLHVKHYYLHYLPPACMKQVWLRLHYLPPAWNEIGSFFVCQLKENMYYLFDSCLIYFRTNKSLPIAVFGSWLQGEGENNFLLVVTHETIWELRS